STKSGTSARQNEWLRWKNFQRPASRQRLQAFERGRNMKITVTILISFLFLACGSKPAEQIAFPTTCKAEDDKRYVQFSGYVTDGGSVFCSNTGGRMECGFELTEKPDGGAKINVD